MAAATITIKLQHCVWRDGRPRFVPGPRLRALGFTGRDLKAPDGTWMDLADVQAFQTDLQADIARRAALQVAGKRLPRAKQSSFYRVADLMQDTFERPKFQKQQATNVKVLAPATITSYKKSATALQKFDADIWVSPVLAINTVIAFDLYERLYAEKGLHQARAVMALLRMAWNWARKKGKAHQNPFLMLDMDMPEGRVRHQTPQHIRHLMATCDANRRPELGDMVLLAVLSCQRQTERLALEGGHISGGRIQLRQSKRGKHVSFAVVADLAGRLAAARQRREAHTVQWPHVVIDEQRQVPWAASAYSHEFTRLVKLAAVDCPDLQGLQDRDLRDVGLHWAKQGGAEFDKRRKLSGHAATAEAMEEKHYTGPTVTDGDAAVSAIVSTWEKGK
jgi:hypothetical protein